MSDIGALVDFPLSVINVASPACIGLEMNAIGTNSLNFNSASVAWPSSNLAIYLPLKLGYIFTLNTMYWVNGVTVGTNTIDVGVYDSQGNQLVHSGTTLTSGTSVIQSVSVSSTTLYPGLYYMAMVMNGTTDLVKSCNGITNAALVGVFGIFSQTSASPLPSTASFSSSTSTFIPLIGMTGNSTL